MLRVMLTILVITRISPAKCQENTESIVETTSSRGTTGTIFNDLVDAEFIEEGVTGLKGFIPDDSVSVNTEGKHELKDFIQTSWLQQNFTTFTTPITLDQAENVEKDKESVSETDDITSTNIYFKLTDGYNIQTISTNDSNIKSITIPYNEKDFTSKITKFTTEQTLISQNTNDDLDDINLNYIYDDQIYAGPNDSTFVIRTNESNLSSIKEIPATQTSTSETTSQPKENDENLLSISNINSLNSTRVSSNDKENFSFSDAINESNLNNFNMVTTTEETISSEAINLEQTTEQNYKKDDSILTTANTLVFTTQFSSDEIGFSSQSTKFPLKFDIEESIITVPSVVMEQMYTKINFRLEEQENSFLNTVSDIEVDKETSSMEKVKFTPFREALTTKVYAQTPISLIDEATTGKTESLESAFLNIDSDVKNSNEEVNESLEKDTFSPLRDVNMLDDNIDTVRTEIYMQTTPIVLTEATTVGKAVINEELDKLQHFKTPEYNQINANNSNKNTYKKDVSKESTTDSSLLIDDKNTFTSSDTSQEDYVADFFTSRPTILPITEISNKAEESKFDETDFLASTSTTIASVNLNSEILEKTEKSPMNDMYSTSNRTDVTLIIDEAIASVPPNFEILEQTEKASTNDIHSTSDTIETATIIDDTLSIDEASSHTPFNEKTATNSVYNGDLEGISEISSIQTDNWEYRGNGDPYGFTTPTKNDETSTETTTSIIDIWLAESTNRNNGGSSLSIVAQEYNSFSHAIEDETTQGKNMNDLDDVTTKSTDTTFTHDISEFLEGSTTANQLEVTTFKTARSTDDVTRKSSIFTDDFAETTESNTTFNKNEATFETSATSMNGINYVTTKLTYADNEFETASKTTTENINNVDNITTKYINTILPEAVIGNEASTTLDELETTFKTNSENVIGVDDITAKFDVTNVSESTTNFDELEITFKTITTNTNGVDDVTIKSTSSVFPEDVTDIFEGSTTFNKLENTFKITTASTNDIDDIIKSTNAGFPESGVEIYDTNAIFNKYETTTFKPLFENASPLANLEVDENETPTSFNSIATSNEFLEYNKDRFENTLGNVEYRTIPSKLYTEAVVETSTERKPRHQKELTYESSTNNAMEDMSTNLQFEEFTITGKPNLQNSIVDTFTQTDSNEENDSSTIFSKEVVDNGQFTADAINILKENDYETTENIKLSVENVEFTENPVSTIVDETTNFLTTVPPLQELKISNVFEEHFEVVENNNSTETEQYSSSLTITEINENENYFSKNGETTKTYKSQATDFPSTPWIFTDNIRNNESVQSKFSIVDMVDEEKITNTFITTTAINNLISPNFEQKSEIAESEEQNKDNLNKIIRSQENVERETKTNRTFLDNFSLMSTTKTIMEEIDKKEIEIEDNRFEQEKESEEKEDIIKGDVGSGGSLEENDKEQNYTEGDLFQKDDFITTDTIISSMKELEELDSDTLNQTTFKNSDDSTTSMNTLESIDKNEVFTRLNFDEKEAFSKYVFKTYIDKTTTERVEIDTREIFSAHENFGNLLKGENGNILANRNTKRNMSVESVKSWHKISLNELTEEEENFHIDENNEDEVDDVKLLKKELANETNENSFRDAVSVNYYDEDYNHSEEFSSTEVIFSDNQSDYAPYISINPNRKDELCLQGNISMKMWIGEHSIKVPNNSQVFANCTRQIHNLIISWRSMGLENTNNTILIVIEAKKMNYFIDSVEVIHTDTVGAIKSTTSGLTLLTTPIDEIMSGTVTIDFKNGYQLEVVDVNLRLNQIVDYSDSKSASQATPIISKMMVIIICTSAISCLIFIIAATILYKKFSAKATVYKMTIE